MTFGEFTLGPAAGELRRAGEKVRIQDLPFRVLTTLLARPGDVVTREELRASLWGAETFVDAEGSAMAAVARRAAELRVELKAVTAMKEPSRVYFAETRGRGVFLRAAPVNVSEELIERLYRRLDTVVFTSATLAAGGRLDYFRHQVGLAPEFDVSEAIYPGPFDYVKQAALLVPNGVPDPAAPDFFQSAAGVIRDLVDVTGGRAFVLSTSVRGMNALRAALDDLPYQLLLQGERPKAKLLESFRATGPIGNWCCGRTRRGRTSACLPTTTMCGSTLNPWRKNSRLGCWRAAGWAICDRVCSS